MKTLVLVFHPDLSRSRANAALLSAARELPADTVTVRDEYALYPNGKIDVAAEQQLVEEHDRIVLQFPLYWYSSPALLKEWEDKVLEYGWAYGTDGEALVGKQIMVATTAGGPESEYQPVDNGATIGEVLSPYRMMARYTHAVWREPFVVFESMELDDAALADAGRRYQDALTAE
ncbi:NAD(P)H oxidoreductase [Bifidobacterium ramosum]|uniref:Flavodoxin family protein n=1 Tax=Bifidobacterium ramosum TaxID=1798158 RepID=A0A6L4WX97_9BIFI|nr:NAD(P)H-dependent oxidoreductase [Bifidobacterium ramosum]KAB8286835.1 NAD(P)H oxidoreductase [Bifidobacterium ramosum]NEG72673.1 flavodoxin family protein [Bifidobacterium ramosum]